MVQKTRIIRSRKNSGSETSPYWGWVHNSGIVKQKDGDNWEPTQGNPDMLGEDAGYMHQVPKATAEQAELIKEGLALLSRQQLRVVETMAEGKSIREAAAELEMKVSTFRNHLNRARKKVIAYVAQNAD